jgi:phosphoserine phosphatase RsbU/P
VSATDEQADSAAERLRRIEPLIDRDLVHLELDDLLSELLDRAREVLNADTATVLLLEESGRELVATAASGLDEELRMGQRVPLGRGFVGRVALERRPVVISEVTPSNVLNNVLIETGVRSLVGVPLIAGGRLLGVVHVGTLKPREFTELDVELLETVAGQAALAAQARLSATQRAAARALQRSLLPTTLPRLPGLQLAGRYVPGEQDGVSGDWYDVFFLPGGELAVVIGDAMGHGLRASVVMGRLRSTLRAYALETTDPADVVTRLDRKLQHFEPDELATVLYGIFDESLETIRFASAGHAMPVLAMPGSPAKVLDFKADPPLGTPNPAHRQTHTVALPPESLLLCFTDGLVERRNELLDRQLERLCAATTAGPPEQVCSTVMRTLLSDATPQDDVAVLAAWRH